MVSYVLSMRERLDKITELIQVNLAKAQQYQKVWYDRTARNHEFKAGDRVLVLLPTSTHKLRAKWHGPYTVVKRLAYVVNMANKNKHHRIFHVHVNMLRQWHEYRRHYTIDSGHGR